jgi:superfamily I DNA/RNA helicase/uncharacterized tellurite resistance protein B-like protein
MSKLEESKEHIIKLLVAFAMVDGEWHEKEADLIEKKCEEFGIDKTIVDKVLGSFNSGNDNDDEVSKYIKKIHKIHRVECLNLLNELSLADGVLAKEELNLLKKLSSLWDIKIFRLGKDNFSESQLQVIEANKHSKIKVIAGAGTGKTEVACSRIAYLINECSIDPSQILIVSFTRTAVKEIKDRIDAKLESSDDSYGLKICTIDQHAWSIRYGYHEGDFKSLFGETDNKALNTYDHSIKDAEKRIKENPQIVKNELSQLRHVIVDEAQDITGFRSDFLKIILSSIKIDCGITVFGDPAQAIYGFTNEKEGSPRENEEVLDHNFLSNIDIYWPKTFKTLQLKDIFRTDSSKLQNMFKNLRGLLIDDKDSKGYEIYNNVREQVLALSDPNEKDAFKWTDAKRLDHALFLFRTRMEVVEASYYCCKHKLRHRLRLGGINQLAMPVIGMIFENFRDEFINFEQFKTLTKAKLKDLKTPELNYIIRKKGRSINASQHLNHLINFLWEDLMVHCNYKKKLSVKNLRKFLSKKRPPLEMCEPELNPSGAILGTIHASKGREKGDVILHYPIEKYKEKVKNSKTILEEARVLGVALTRPIHNITVKTSTFDKLESDYTDQHFNSLNIGRVIRKKANDYSYSVEIGLSDDLDESSFVNERLDLQFVKEMQSFLRDIRDTKPIRVYANYNYEIKQHELYTPSQITMKDLKLSAKVPSFQKPFGLLSKQVNNDFWTLANYKGANKSWSFYPRASLNKIFIMGVKTVAIGTDDPNLDFIHPYFAESGIWLSPIIRGYSDLYFDFRNSRKSYAYR